MKPKKHNRRDADLFGPEGMEKVLEGTVGVAVEAGAVSTKDLSFPNVIYSHADKYLFSQNIA